MIWPIIPIILVCGLCLPKYIKHVQQKVHQTYTKHIPIIDQSYIQICIYNIQKNYQAASGPAAVGPGRTAGRFAKVWQRYTNGIQKVHQTYTKHTPIIHTNMYIQYSIRRKYQAASGPAVVGPGRTAGRFRPGPPAAGPAAAW